MGTGLGLGVLLSSLGSSVLYLQQALADTVSLKVGMLIDCSTLRSQQVFLAGFLSIQQMAGNICFAFKKIEKFLLFLQQWKKCMKHSLVLFITLKRKKRATSVLVMI